MSIRQRTSLRQSRYISTPMGAIDVLIIKHKDMMTNLLFNRLTAIGKRLAMVLTMLLIVGIGQVWGENIFDKLYLSAKNTPQNSSNWTFTDATCNNANSDYWKMVKKTSVVTSPEFDISGYTNVTVEIKWQNFGTFNESKSNATIKVSTAKGIWTPIGTTGLSEKGTITKTFENVEVLSSYKQAQIQISTPNADGSNGGRLIHVIITGDVSSSSETPDSYTVNWHVNGTVKHTQTATAGTTLTNIPTPTTADCDNSKVFVGWTTTADYSNATTAPSGMLTNTSGMTMPEGGGDYYAVFATETGGGSTTDTYDWESTSTGNWTVDSNIARTASQGVNSSYAGKISTAHTYVTYTKKVAVTEFSFDFKRATNNTNYNVYIETSTDKNTWSTAVTYAMSTFGNGSYTSKSQTFDGNTELYVRFHCYNTTATRYVDNVSITYGGGTTYADYTTQCSAKPSVTLNPNGGTISASGWTLENGAYKLTTEDESITLPAISRTGYTFAGWATSASGSIVYEDKATISGLDGTAVTLYAIWAQTTCTITYNANGGEGTVTDTKSPYNNGATVTVVGNYGKLTKDGYAFIGWSDGTNTYKAGDQFTISANTTLYAQWCKAYWKLVTDASELENDTRIVIAAKDETVALSTEQNKNNRGQANITKKYNTITFGTDVQALVLLQTGNKFELYTGSGYLYASGDGNNNYLQMGTAHADTYNWTFVISQDGTATIVANGTNSNNTLRYNATSDLFSCYGSGNTQKDVVIYKEVCKQDLYNVTSTLTNAGASGNPTTVSATATSLTLNYTANTGYLLPETITVKMGGVALSNTDDYTWDKENGQLTINVTGFYGDIDVKIVAEADPCYGFAMSTVTATSTTNSITLTWTEVAGATGYKVRLKDNDFTVVTGTTHTFNGLNARTPYAWEVKAINASCESEVKSGNITTAKETFTINWVVNGDTENPVLTEDVVDGEKITQYPSTEPSAPSGCSTKVFVGWTNKTIETPTNDVPTLYTAVAEIPAITANTTFHAVFADEAGQGETTKSLLNTEIQTFHKQGTTTSYSDLTIPSTDGDWSGLFCTANSSSVYTINLKKAAVNDKRPYLKSSEYNSITTVSVVATHASTKGNRILYLCNAETDSPESNNIGTISVAKDNNTSQVCTLSSSATTLYLYVDNGLQIKTITLTTGGRTYSAYTTLCDNCTPSMLTISADKTTENLGVDGKAVVNFTPTGGNGGKITYTANPSTGVSWNGAVATFNKAGTYTISASQAKNGDNCPTISNEVEITITATPVLYFTTTPADPIVFDPVNCGSTTVLANKKSVELQGYNLSGDVTVTVVGDYKIAKTSTATLADYSTTLTLAKTDAGKINGNDDVVYILSCPPAGGTAATEGTLTFTTTNGNKLTVNLSTPTVNCTTYALTFNDRGNKTVENYYAGVEVPQPEDPTGVCTDPIHYVFDGWAEATVTNGLTEYTKVIFPYSMPNKATTLYAVYRYADGNASENKFMSVDKEIGELESGKDYVLTGYYETDEKEYALSITDYETGKYKTKQVDVQESSTKYDDGSSYYELETTDGEIIWTIVGDDTNGYTFQNKSNNKYLNIDGNNLVLGDENDHMFTIEHETDVVDEQHGYYMSLLIQPKDDDSKYLSSYYKSNASQVLFNLYTGNTLSLYLYKRAVSYLYTTSPACGPMLEITSGKDIYVTSGYGTGRNTVIAQQTVEYRATRLSTNNAGIVPDVKVAANGVTMGGVVTNNLKVVGLTQNKELIGDKYTITGTVTVQYTPTANDLQEDIQVQLAVDYNTDAKDNFTVHARSLPSAFVIVAKQGDKWYALNADMSGNDAEKANGYLQVDDIEDPTKATFAPCNTIYTFDGMVDGGNKEYMRFQGIDGKYLWAASAGNTGIQNYAKNTPAAGTIAYNWQLYTNDNETYQLQNEGNGRKLGLSKDLNYGMYSYVSTLQQDIRILPYVEKCIYNYAPTNLKVSVLKSTDVTLTWDAVAGATKYQYSTNGTNWTDAGTEPTVTINDLEGNTKYTYYIRAYHEDAGVTNECIDYAEITFTTANCDDVPTDITYTADLNSITVTWTAVSTNCEVRLYSDEACTSVVKFADELNGSVTFSQLGRNTKYYVQILADGTCASPIIPVKTEDVEVDIVEWMPDGIIVDINTNETVGVTLENEVSYGSGAGQNAEELFFSKYFEGSGSLKMIAIYNGTGKDVDLSTYRIDRGSNGNAKNISKTYDLSQLGTIKNGQEIIFYSWPLNTDTEASVYTCSQSFLDGKTNESGVDANPRWILCDANPHNGVEFETMDFSGDDPLLFYKGSTLIDVFGVSRAADRPSKKTQCEGRSEESWSAAEVTNMDYGKTEADFEDGNVPEGVDLLNPTITAYTARVIMFRKNTVLSGNDAVTKNVTDFVTLADEWEARSVCHSGGDGDLTCGAYQELGTFDYSDYYTKYEKMGNEQIFDENARNDDGTVTIPITDLYKHACSNIRVKLSNSNGDVLTDREYKVPIMITTTQGTDGEAFIALQDNLAMMEITGDGDTIYHPLELNDVREICKTCDVVIRDSATLTKVTDGTENDHPQVHDVIVYEGASIVIPDGDDHNYTINSLSLRRKGDNVASAQVQGTGKLVLPADVPVTLNMRIDANNWHWFTLPYDCDIADVTWSDGTEAKYNTDWFLMYYDGESRAASTNPHDNHWKVYNGTTIEAGKGYIIGITGDLAHPNYTFELRFPMEQDVLTAEQTNKTVALNAWGVQSDNTPNNKGWNLVGNPYLNYYKTADEYSYEGLPLLQYTGIDPVTGDRLYDDNGNIPFLVTPIDGGWYEYRQELASEVNMMPFTAYFVQVGDPKIHTNGQDLNASFEASNRGKKSIVRRAPREVEEIEEPIIVRVELTNSKGESDKTSLVIDDRFTNEYEMNGDFFKWFGDYYNYYTKPVLYTIGADQGKRAFNALNEELAKQPIPMGMYAAQAGNYTFSLNQQFDLSRVEEVWLYDATENVYTNLMQQDYTFSTTKVNGEGRFSLSVKMMPELSTEIENIKQGNIWATTRNNEIVVNGLSKGMQLWIYDATGKLLHSDRTTNYQHSYGIPQTGAYFIRVHNNNNEAQTIAVVVE